MSTCDYCCLPEPKASLIRSGFSSCIVIIRKTNKMSTEATLMDWLHRPEKSFIHRLEFAIKAWQSAELTLSSKYEIILNWLSKEGSIEIHNSPSRFPLEICSELLRLRAPPGLVSIQTKSAFVEMFLQSAGYLRKMNTDSTRLVLEMLHQLIDFELLQDLYRSDYELLACAYATLLSEYEIYLDQEYSVKTFQTAHESEFFQSLIHSIKNNAKRCGEIEKFANSYTEHTLKPLSQVVLVFRTHGMCYFDEFLALEQIFYEKYTEKDLLNRIQCLPLHVRLLCLESAIITRRNVEHFLQLLLTNIFENLLATEINETPALVLTVIAYTLEMLRKHEVNINFQIKEKESAMTFLGIQLLSCVQQYKESHLREVLMLLCAALRFNPLILEQHVFQITVWMIVAPKPVEIDVMQLYTDFLTQLMDMFRRLSRAEKFIGNLLKVLNEWLQKYQLSDLQKEGKRKSMQVIDTPSKRLKLNENGVNKSNSTSIVDKHDYYIDVLLKGFYMPVQNSNNFIPHTSSICSFAHLQTSWPSDTVGKAFSQLVTSLVSKPSLVIWKTLLHALNELIDLMQHRSELDQNVLFQLDLHAALLCQYFAGSRLVEQLDRFVEEISNQNQFTAEVLGTFGRFVLSREHNKRTMHAFLECTYQAANFELLLEYYRPDGLVNTSTLPAMVPERLHAFLSEQEWTLIQQRVLNFGKSNCKFLFNRLLVQRTQAQLLLDINVNISPGLSLQKCLCSAVYDTEQLKIILMSSHGKWLISRLKRIEKLDLSQRFLKSPDILSLFLDDRESLELITLQILANICQLFTTSDSKGALMTTVSNCDFIELCNNNNSKNIKKYMEHLIQIINKHQNQNRIETLPKVEIQELLDTFVQMPIGQLPREYKIVAFVVLLALQSDLRGSEEEALADRVFQLLIDLMHFGQHISIFKYFNTGSILNLLPISHCWAFYETIFTNIKHEEKSFIIFLTALTDILHQAQQKHNLNTDYLRLTLKAITTLANINGPNAKRMRPYLENILNVYAGYINKHFIQYDHDANHKKDKKFVQKTLAGFAPYANMVFAKSAMKGEEGSEELETFRRICKIYIGHSMDYRDPHALQLMQVALNHRQQLHLDQDEIELVLSEYWRQLNDDLTTLATLQDANSTIESAVKIIIGHKTNEDFLLTLKDITSNVEDNQKNLGSAISLLSLLVKCPFSTIKGAILNQHFKHILSAISLCLSKDNNQEVCDTAQVLSILSCLQSFIENRMIPVTSDTLDSILDFLMDININKFVISDNNFRQFYELHLAISDLCLVILKQRYFFFMNRVSQFMRIFKELVQAVICYKSERQKDTILKDTELEYLSELALKLKLLINIAGTQSVHIKRMAPFILMFIINLMVTSKRPTTLYPTVKTNIEHICYDIIGLCDHRASRFILRSSNEAARLVYELMVKEHKKYHKFKGKV